MTAIYEPPTDRAAARRADKSAAAEQDRLDRRDAQQAILARQKMHLDAQLEQARLDAEQRRADKSAAAEQKRVDAEVEQTHKDAERKRKVGEKARRRQLAAARRAKRTTWLKANAALPFVGLVMVCSVVPAVISQVGALSGAHMTVALAGLLATMLEGGAWAITFMGKAAETAGRPARKYRIGTWTAASLAAAINLLHGWQQYPHDRWVAAVLAASSLFAVWIWDLYTHHGKAKTKAEKREEKARAKHLKDRRKHHADAARIADHLLSAAAYGSLDPEEAFRQACEIVHGSTIHGMTPELYALSAASKVRLAAAFDLEPGQSEQIHTGLLESVYGPAKKPLPILGTVFPLRRKSPEKAQVANQIPPASRGRRKPPLRRKGDSQPFHPAARVAARQTSLQNQP